MSDKASESPRCPTCGRPLPAGVAACPGCGQSESQDELRPLGGGDSPGRPAPSPRLPSPPPSGVPAFEPLPPDPGQEPFGTWANIKHTARLDPVFGALLGLLALAVLVNAASGDMFGVLLWAVILWGVVTFRWWGYLLAMLVAGVAVAVELIFLLVALSRGVLALLPLVGFGLAASLFTLIVLYTRRDRFD